MSIDPLPRTHGCAVLRRLCASDLDAFLAYRGDPDVARYQGWDAMDADTARGFLTAMETTPALPIGWWQIGIARQGAPELMGDMGLCLSDDGTEVEMGITLARAAQGSGLARDAVAAAAQMIWDGTKAARIVAITDARNTAALKLIERLGLTRVGTLHDAGFPEPMFEMRRPG